MSILLNPLYSPRKDTPSKSHGHRTVNVSRPGTLSLSLFLSSLLMSFRERSEGRSLADPRESSRLAETRKSARERRFSLLSRWLLLGEKPLAGFGMERRRRRTRAADDPESRLWTFTNASTLPVGVTTRVCTGGRACSSRSPAPAPYPAEAPLASSRPRTVPFFAVPSLPRRHCAPRPPFSSSFASPPIPLPPIHGPAVLPEVRYSTFSR